MQPVFVGLWLLLRLLLLWLLIRTVRRILATHRRTPSRVHLAVIHTWQRWRWLLHRMMMRWRWLRWTSHVVPWR